MNNTRTEETHATVEASSVPRAGFFAVLAAPWIAPFSTARAGRILAGAGPVATILAIGSIILIAAVVVLFCAMWDQTRTVDYEIVWQPFPRAGASQPGTLPADEPEEPPTTARRAEDVIINRSFGEVWHDAPGLFGIGADTLLASIVLFTCLYGILGYAAAGIGTAPRFHDGCGIGRWAKTAAVAPLGGLWVALSAISGIGTFLVVIHDWHEQGIAEQWAAGYSTGPWWFPQPIQVTVIATFSVAASAFMLLRMQRVGMVVAAHVTPTADLPGVRCTGCGYSLEHIPADGRCPECGSDAARSLSPETRPALEWQAPTVDPILAFLRTHVAVLVRPSIAFATMRTRRHLDRAWRFEFMQFLLATIATVLAFELFLLYGWGGGNFEWDELFLGLFVGAVLGMLSFAAHRLAASIALGVASATQPPADVRALAATVGYQSVWVWAFFAWGFGFLFLMNENRVDRLAARLESVFGVSQGTAEAAIFITFQVVNLVLASLWLYRYRIAFRAVRWANY